MTKDEFEKGYAERSGITVERLHKLGRFATPCDCDSMDCFGWQMTHKPQVPNTYEFPNGLTVTELKRVVDSWPKTDHHGTPTTVWVETGRGTDSPVVNIGPVDLTDMEMAGGGTGWR